MQVQAAIKPLSALRSSSKYLFPRVSPQLRLDLHEAQCSSGGVRFSATFAFAFIPRVVSHRITSGLHASTAGAPMQPDVDSVTYAATKGAKWASALTPFMTSLSDAKGLQGLRRSKMNFVAKASDAQQNGVFKSSS